MLTREAIPCRMSGGALIVLVGMMLCFASGISLGPLGIVLFCLVGIVLFSWSLRHPAVHHGSSARFSTGSACWLAGSFFWGLTNHGDFRSIRPGVFQIVATGSAYSSHGTTVLIEGTRGRTLVSLAHAVSSNQVGQTINLRKCGHGRWMIPGRCVVQHEQAANLGKGPRSNGKALRGVIFSLRRAASNYLNSFGPVAGAWLKALLLGMATNSSGHLLESFRGIGLLHFLVVSGAHVTLVHRFTHGFMLVLRRVAGGFIPFLPPISSGPNWLLAAPSLVVTGLFCLLAGLEPPVQRSLCGLCVVQALDASGARPSRGATIASTFLLQAFLWPVGFLSRSNLLSWVAWLIVLLARPALTVWPSFGRACFRQMLMAFALATITGIGACAGIIANLVFLPVLEIFFIFCIVVTVAGPNFGAMVDFNRMVETICEWAFLISQKASGGIFYQLDAWITHPHVRVGLMVMAWVWACLYVTSTLLASERPSIPIPGFTAD